MWGDHLQREVHVRLSGAACTYMYVRKCEWCSMYISTHSRVCELALLYIYMYTRTYIQGNPLNTELEGLMKSVHVIRTVRNARDTAGAV